MLRGFVLGKRAQESLILLATICLVASGCSSETSESSIIEGMVKDASGEPAQGALVKISSAEVGVTFMVVSTEQGLFKTPSLPKSSYVLQAFGGYHQSNPSEPAEVNGTDKKTVDLVLDLPRPDRPSEKRVRDADHIESLPEGEGKRLLGARCSNCHGFDRIVRQRLTRDAWFEIVDQMRFYRDDLENPGGPLSEEERDVVVDYVSRHLGADKPPRSSPESPDDPHRKLPRTLLIGPESQYLAMEFDLRDRFGVHEIAVDSKGVVWVSEEKPGGMLGRFDPETFDYTQLELPAAESPQRNPGAIWVDGQDKIWISDGSSHSQLFRYDPETGGFESFDIPVPPRMRAPINSIRVHPDGSVWGTGISSHRIVKLDPVSGEVTDFPVPRGWHPYGLAIGKDGSVWFVSSYGNAIGKVDVGSGEVTHFKLPEVRSDPRRMAADSEGNLWVALHEKSKLLKVDHRNGDFTEFNIPTADAGPHTVWVDQQDFVWFGERLADKIGRYDPRTDSFLEFPLPSADTDVRRIQVDPTNPNRVWAEGRIGKIVYVERLE